MQFNLKFMFKMTHIACTPGSVYYICTYKRWERLLIMIIVTQCHKHPMLSKSPSSKSPSFTLLYSQILLLNLYLKPVKGHTYKWTQSNNLHHFNIKCESTNIILPLRLSQLTSQGRAKRFLCVSCQFATVLWFRGIGLNAEDTFQLNVLSCRTD